MGNKPSLLDTQALILQELREANRRLARIEDAIPVLSALSSGGEGEQALREQRRTRQVRDRRYLSKKLGDRPIRGRANGRRRP